MDSETHQSYTAGLKPRESQHLLEPERGRELDPPPQSHSKAQALQPCLGQAARAGGRLRGRLPPSSPTQHLHDLDEPPHLSEAVRHL